MEGSGLICGAISDSGKFIVEIVDGTMNSTTYLDILKRRLLRNFPTSRAESPLCAKYSRLIYQRDGATAHTASVITAYFEYKEIEVLDWPPKSPDLNLIESVWSQLKANLKISYKGSEELKEDIIRSSKSIHSSYIKNLYLSMKRRLQAIIEAKGGPTNY